MILKCRQEQIIKSKKLYSTLTLLLVIYNNIKIYTFFIFFL